MAKIAMAFQPKRLRHGDVGEEGRCIGAVGRCVLNPLHHPPLDSARRSKGHGGAWIAGRDDDFGADDTSILQANAFRFSALRSEEHTSELQSLMRISYAVFCIKK